MQLRCTYCQTMFNITQDEMLAGLEHMEEQKQSYYDAHCPKCRRANRVERARMERFFRIGKKPSTRWRRIHPGWERTHQTRRCRSKGFFIKEKTIFPGKKQPAGSNKK